ncbi:glycoside hydrolase family 16 protein [Adhaeribacter rhizoryzae]|uniref:Glycoside hydrolase family 16 protein n=1 Tax=Adhaeribacter rhizoryzae TaxID=2607907 RepID=A0A5M6DGQ2_9BACT|nr:glycoside hydrolase family 16 protein [Adhaeribacter rhizoryzae]KAA5546691.1 glycoside hydrolase family 16 protein [Adhaeribacter rhizoryzae]
MAYFSLLVVFCYTLFSRPTPNPQPQKLKLVWADEFNYKGQPNPKKWVEEEGYIRNKEEQYYTKGRLENARVENGNLVIEARQDSLLVKGKKVPVTSASLTTQGTGEWQYGRIEVRAKIPSARGTWPAIWMLGKNIKQVGWPACGEIDMMENVGFDPDTVHFNVHTQAYNHTKNTNKGRKVGLTKPYADFHLYAVDWTEDKIDFLLDNKVVFTFKNEGTGSSTWPFNRPFYLILNLAIGGAWGGQRGVDLQALPQKYYIDYVRVYQ